MGKIIVKHRRGTTLKWSTSNIIPYDGEIVIEQCIDGSTRIKVGNGIDKFNTLPYMDTLECDVSIKKTNITLYAANWIGTESPYFQDIIIENTTINSKIDLQPTPEILSWLQNQKISLTTVNDDGNIKVYAINGKPSINLTIQATILETTD